MRGGVVYLSMTLRVGERERRTEGGSEEGGNLRGIGMKVERILGG